MKHGQEKSDLFIIALKPTNKPGRLGAELVEPRERTEGNMGGQHTYRTLRRIKRVPEARLCSRSCSWESTLATRGGNPVGESRPPGSVRRASRTAAPDRDMCWRKACLCFTEFFRFHGPNALIIESHCSAAFSDLRRVASPSTGCTSPGASGTSPSRS